jgi:hypothetical protein
MISEIFPWLGDLPQEEQDDFLQEIMAMASAGVDLGYSLDTFAEKLETHIGEWKATAEAHAYGLPEILATATMGDFGPVEPPAKPKPKGRRCSASTPYEEADKGWAWCVLSSGHQGRHEDADGIPWSDGDVVEVRIVAEIRSVRDHQHDFVGDQDECVGEPSCRLTYGEFKTQKREGSDD